MRTFDQINGHTVEIVDGQHNAAWIARHQSIEARTPFHVDVLGTGVECLTKQPAPFVFRSGKRATLPLRTAGDDRGTTAALERTRDIGIAHGVETQLHEIGIVDPIAARSQLGGRGRRHRGADAGPLGRHSFPGSFTSKKKASSTGNG
jgi:hypothetical protein